MAQYLNAFSGRQFLDANGAPYSGAKLFVYIAGSSTKATVTKDSAGLSNHTNPIILNTRGEPADGGGASQAIWQTGGQSVKLVLAPSTDTDPPVAAISTWDNLSGINDTSVTIDQWITGPTPTYVGATSFTLIGDQTSTFHIGRRIKTTNSGGTIYSTITNSVYGALTTITVVNDSGSLDSGLSAVSYGILSAANTSIPGVKLSGSDYTHQGTVTMLGKSHWTAEGASVASAADCNIWTTDGNTVHVTGNTQIDDWGTAPQAGAWKRVIIDGTPILGYNAITNDLPANANITAAANDSFVVYARSTSSYQIFDYTRESGQPITAPTAAQGASLVLISSTTASSSATIDFTSGITSTYDEYEIHLVNVIPATDDVNLWMRTDADAGASFDAADYLYSGTGTSSLGTTLNYSPGTVQAQILINSTAVGGSLDNNAGSGLCGVIKLFTPASTAVRKKFMWQVSYQTNEAGANHIANVSGSGAYTGTTALINAVRFLMSAGNITSGSFYLYGIKKA